MSSAGDDVIGLERAALDRWEKGDPGKYLSLYVDDLTYFDWNRETRLDGITALRALLEPFAGTFHYDRIDIANPRVQVHGDAAVLTYNAKDCEADGTERRAGRANVTEVYFRIDGAWRLVHSHFSRASAGGAAAP